MKVLALLRQAEEDCRKFKERAEKSLNELGKEAQKLTSENDKACIDLDDLIVENKSLHSTIKRLRDRYEPDVQEWERDENGDAPRARGEVVSHA
tara:strand:+ start:7796 stop:8077 length:282 start_codon:yes stop_codon:yes gene_type:complete